jgi:hypothetical protein
VQVTAQLTGNQLSAGELAKLNDPIAKLVLLEGGGLGCPTSFSAVNQKLAKTDAAKCVAHGSGVHVVSDRAQLLGAPDPAPAYRAVVNRDCGHARSTSSSCRCSA